MGAILKAICQNCGFKQKTRLGAGFFNFQTTAYVPALNTENEFVTVNIKDEQYNEYKFYNDPTMYFVSKEKPFYHYWRNIRLHRENNYCPQCELKEMAFLCVGCFD